MARRVPVVEVDMKSQKRMRRTRDEVEWVVSSGVGDGMRTSAVTGPASVLHPKKAQFLALSHSIKRNNRNTQHTQHLIENTFKAQIVLVH
jgi:hypothetical protein